MGWGSFWKAIYVSQPEIIGKLKGNSDSWQTLVEEVIARKRGELESNFSFLFSVFVCEEDGAESGPIGGILKWNLAKFYVLYF